MGKYLKLAWRNMWRNWRRTSIALVAIVLGLILLLFMDGMIKGSDQAIFGNAVRLYGGNLQIHAPGYREKAARLPLLPLTDAEAAVEAARAHPEVATASQRINTVGLVSSREGSYPAMITALEPAVEAPLSLHAQNITQGRFLSPEDGDAVVIGQALAEQLKVSVGDQINVIGRRKNEDMRQRGMMVVGIYSLGVPDAEKTTVFINLPTAQTLYNLRDQATEVPVFLKTIGAEALVASALQSNLPNAEVDTWQVLRPDITETFSQKLTFTTFFGMVVLFIAAIGLLNIMLMAVFERTREMGVLAALGMKGRQIMGLFLLEGALIGVVGAVIGCALSALLIGLLGSVGIDLSKFTAGMGEISALMGTHLYPAITITDLISRGLFVVILATLAALYPAWQASRKEPTQALHHV